MAKLYKAEFFSGLPKEGQVAPMTLYVDANSNMAALEKASHQAMKNGDNYPYVSVKEVGT